MSRSVCWYSWRAQLASLAKLLKYDLEWVLPGHGRRFQAASAAEMRGAITELLSELNAP
jgi:glyoxylase-like metal-dependent hydrolase (beta-lactamase superfamily II)